MSFSSHGLLHTILLFDLKTFLLSEELKIPSFGLM